MARSADELSREFSRLTDRLLHLEVTLLNLRNRIEALEQRRELAPLPPPTAPSTLSPPPPPPVSSQQVTTQETPPHLPEPVHTVATEYATAQVEAPTISEPTPQPEFAPASPAVIELPAPPQEPPLTRHELPENWLTEVALKWAAPRVAGVALILAAIFALQWAIQNQRVSPAGQIGLGLVAGVALLVFGDLSVRKQRKILGEALLGSGAALLYVDIYAAYAAFNPPVIGYVSAFAGLTLVTALAVFLAIRGDAQSTAILALLGGFLTPRLLQGTGGSPTGMSDLIGLFVYVAILDLGLLAASLYRRWRPLQVLCFIATWVLLWTWLSNLTDPGLRYVTVVPATGLFIIFLLVPVIWNLRLRQPTEPTDLGLILANPSCFCPTAALLIAIYHPEWLGALAVGLALLYLALGEVARRRHPDDKLLHGSWLSLGLTLLTIAIPLQLQGEWIMIAWGVEGALLVWVGFQACSYTVRVLGLALQTIVFGWLLLLYRLADPLSPDVLPVANTLFMSYLSGTLTLAVSLLLYLRNEAPVEERRQSMGALAVGLITLLVAGGCFELSRLELPFHIHLVWWSVAAAATMTVGHVWRSYTVRVMGHLLNGALIIGLTLLYGLQPEPVWLQNHLPVFNEVCLTYLIGIMALLVTLVFYTRAKELTPGEDGLAGPYATILGLLVAWAGTSELLRLNMPSHLHMVWFAMVSAAMVWSGDRFRSKALCGAGLVLQAVMIFWMVMLHSLQPSPVWLTWRWPILNEIFLAYLVGLAALAMTINLLGRRSDEELVVPEPLYPAGMVVLALLALWSVIADLQEIDAPGHTLLAWWAVASAAVMVIGHRYNRVSLRITACVLQSILAIWLLFLYASAPEPLWWPGHQPIANELFAVFLIGLGSLGVTAALYGQTDLETREVIWVRHSLPIVLVVLGLWGLTADVSRGLDEMSRRFVALQGVKGFGISLLWCLYAAGLVWYSLLRRRVEVRLAGVVVFGLAVFKVFLVDTWQLETVWKALSYACLAGILLGVSYLYLLHREKLQALFATNVPADVPEVSKE